MKHIALNKDIKLRSGIQQLKIMNTQYILNIFIHKISTQEVKKTDSIQKCEIYLCTIIIYNRQLYGSHQI